MTDRKFDCEPLISIVVPAYNIAPYIVRCVKSIQGQTYSNIEIILVENGSTDGTSEIVDTFFSGDRRVIVIHERSQGVTHARLTGVKVASGEWIGFVDGDDYIEPDMFERLLFNARLYQARISHCGYQMIFEDGRTRFFYNTGRLVRQDRLTGLRDLLSGPFIEPGLGNKLFHYSLFKQFFSSSLVDYSIKNNEDLLMNFLLFKESNCSVYEDFCPYHYIIRSGSASRKGLNANRIYDPIKVKQRIIEIAPDELKDEAIAAYIATCINVYNILACEKGHRYDTDKTKIRELILKCSSDFDLLSKRSGMLVKMIVQIPSLYPFIYRFYTKTFQKRRYE